MRFRFVDVISIMIGGAVGAGASAEDVRRSLRAVVDNEVYWQRFARAETLIEELLGGEAGFVEDPHPYGDRGEP